MIFVRPLL